MTDRMHWLSYGGGVNSTALAVLLCEGKLPHYTPWRCVWADTQDEKDETYEYVFTVMMPYLRRHGVTLEIVRDYHGVIERWERSGYVGSRQSRSCTDNAKTQPIRRHIAAHSRGESCQLIGIDAGESHRAKDRDGVLFPLVELNIDRQGCEQIIRDASLPIPPKSGCWHCPFNRVAEILELASDRPERMRRIIALEMAAEKRLGEPIYQWGRKSAKEWAARACSENSSGPLFQEIDPDPPCGCYDG